MVPGDNNIYISAASPSFLGSTRPLTNCGRAFAISLGIIPAFIFLAISLTGCTRSEADNRQVEAAGRSLLCNLRPKADPAAIARVIEEEKEAAQAQSQTVVYADGASAEQIRSGLGRKLPNVSRDPFSQALIAPAADTVNADGTILASNNSANASYHQGAQLASYESAYANSYNAVPPPPPGALGAGLVPPPPAVTLSTQAQAVADSAAAFYGNPYFNPFGVPAPPQAVPARRPAGLFGEGASSDQYDDSSRQRHRSDFVPITPKGMEARSPYKQRDDLRILWKGALKGSVNIGELAENNKLIEQLGHIDVGLPGESSKGSFSVSSRQIESLFKASAIDKRALPEVRKLQTELVQAYYRYLSTYNKYALVEQTVAARKQEIDLSESDAEKQRATADLSQSQSDLDAAKEDVRSAEIELAAASSAASARSVISRVAGIAPSVETLAQGVAQIGNHSVAHTRRLINIFDSVFKHPHQEVAESEPVRSDDLTANPDVISNNSATKGNKGKLAAKNNESRDQANKNKIGLFGRMLGSSKDSSEYPSASQTNKISRSADDLEASPSPADKPTISENIPHHDHSTNSTPSNINFVLKNVTVNPRKSVLTVAVKNSGSDVFDLNPDAIYIAEGTRKLGASALRADFDTTAIEPNQEVKGTITVFSRPWNDKLVIYLPNGNKTVQLKR